MLYWKMEKTSLPFWQKVKGKIAQSKIFKHIFSAPLVKQYVCLSISVCTDYGHLMKNKSKKSENLDRCGRQNMLGP